MGREASYLWKVLLLNTYLWVSSPMGKLWSAQLSHTDGGELYLALPCKVTWEPYTGIATLSTVRVSSVPRAAVLGSQPSAHPSHQSPSCLNKKMKSQLLSRGCLGIGKHRAQQK